MSFITCWRLKDYYNMYNYLRIMLHVIMIVFFQEVTKIKKSKSADGSLKKKEKSKSGKYSKVPPPKEQVAVEEPPSEEEPMEGIR